MSLAELAKQFGKTKSQDVKELELSQIQSYNTFKDYGQAMFINGKLANAHNQSLMPNMMEDTTRYDFLSQMNISVRNLLRSFLVNIHNLALPYSLELWITWKYGEQIFGRHWQEGRSIAGPEFKELEGHILIIYNLQGLIWS